MLYIFIEVFAVPVVSKLQLILQSCTQVIFERTLMGYVLQLYYWQPVKLSRLTFHVHRATKSKWEKYGPTMRFTKGELYTLIHIACNADLSAADFIHR